MSEQSPRPSLKWGGKTDKSSITQPQIVRSRSNLV